MSELTNSQKYWIGDIRLNAEDMHKQGKITKDELDAIDREGQRIIDEGDWQTALFWINTRYKDEGFMDNILKLINT